MQHPKQWICGATVDGPDSDIRHITLERVAIAMAFTNRFNGGFGPADLASHSCRVADRLPPHLRAAGLVHDIGEIVTSDIPSPLKPFAGELPDIEDAWRLRLCQHFFGHARGLQVHNLCGDHRVHEADHADYLEMLPDQQGELAHLEKCLRYGWPPWLEPPLYTANAWLSAMKKEIECLT